MVVNPSFTFNSLTDSHEDTRSVRLAIEMMDFQFLNGFSLMQFSMEYLDSIGFQFLNGFSQVT